MLIFSIYVHEPDNDMEQQTQQGNIEVQLQQSKNIKSSLSTRTGVSSGLNSTLPLLARSDNSKNTAGAIVSDLDKYSKLMLDEIAVAFEKYPPNKYPWCRSTDFPQYSSGFLFHKLYKTGSSTAVGVHIQIANLIGKQKFGHPCTAQYKHQYALQNLQSKRQLSKSFLWTIIRNPTSRSISAMSFYNYDRTIPKSMDKTYEWMLEYLESTKNNQWIQLRDDKLFKYPMKARNGILLDYGRLNLTSFLNANEDNGNLHPPPKLVQLFKEQIFNAYNFVAVLERWSESMVVLSLLLDIPLSATIILKTKSSGGWTWDWKHSDESNGRCFQIPTFYDGNPAVKEYLETNFTKQNYDFLLYDIANRSLDKTIDTLGRRRVETLVEQHRQMQYLAEQKCLEKSVFPCSPSGEWQPGANQNCYWRDMGCGYKCVNEVLSLSLSSSSISNATP